MNITAVVTCYESSATIGLTLLSLFGQSRRPDQIIVTDDGSCGETCRFVTQLLDSISSASDVTCAFVTHQRTTPYRLNTIRNSGIQKATGELVFLIDGDTLVPRDFLQAHEGIHESLMKEGRSAFVSCVKKKMTRGGVIEEGRKSEWGHELDRFLSAGHWDDLDLEPEQTLSASTFLKRDWELVGYFDVDFDGHWGFDEIEFAYRLKKAGVRLTCHGLVYDLDDGAGVGNRDARRNQQLYRHKTTGE